LLDEFGDSPEILAELRDLFIQHLPPLLDEIKAAYEIADSEKLARSAHSLKGASSTYGAERVYHVCRELEVMAKQGQFAAAEETIELLEEELAKLTEAISRLSSSN
jgi:HPt (histidine-containing phosphotransfer) domain-containing protein